MRIWYEFPRPASGAEGYYERLQANWQKVGKWDSELVIKAPTRGTSEFRYSIVGHMYADMLRTTEMVEGIVQAEKEGYDGAVIGCFGDPGLDVLESIVAIPVLGPAKAALIMGRAFGRKMAFITLPHWEHKVEKAVHSYGFGDFLIANRPCRSLEIPLEKFSSEEEVLDSFIAVARGAISDGADIVGLGCVNCSTLLTYKNIFEVDGVPIVDGAIAALKLVEVLADLRNAGMWKSTKSIENDIIEGLRGSYYHGSASV